MILPAPALTLFARTSAQLKTVALTVLPHGGQGTARRNAWASMSADATHARARREASIAVDRANVRAWPTLSTSLSSGSPAASLQPSG